MAGFTQLPRVRNCLRELRPATLALSALMLDSPHFPGHCCAQGQRDRAPEQGVWTGVMILLGGPDPGVSNEHQSQHLIWWFVGFFALAVFLLPFAEIPLEEK